jgi:hypothetical protein
VLPIAGEWSHLTGPAPRFDSLCPFAARQNVRAIVRGHILNTASPAAFLSAGLRLPFLLQVMELRMASIDN